MNRFRIALLGLSLGVLVLCNGATTNFLISNASAQVLGIPAAEVGQGEWKNILAAFPEEPPLALFAWGQAGALNPNGSPSEKWLANEELQGALTKAKKMITDAALQSNDPTAAAWMNGPLWEILGNAGMLVFEDFDMLLARPKISFVSYKYDSETIEQLLNKFDQKGYQKVQIGDDTVHATPEDRAGIGLALGFHGDHLIISTSKQLWETVSKRIDSGQRAPGWARALFARQPLRRLSSFGFTNVSGIRDLLEASKNTFFDQALSVIDDLGVDSALIKQGTDEVSNISIIQVEGDKAGLLSSFGMPALTKEQLDQFPADCSAAVGIKLSPENVINLIQKFQQDQPISEMPPFEQFKKEYELDLKEDILDLLTGEIRGFVSGSILKPKMVGVVGIKDADAFQSTFETINRKVKESLAESDFYEKTGKDGVTVFGFKNSFGSSVYWAVHESELLFGSNSRTISSYLRKRKSRESLLTDQVLVSAILKNPPADSSGPVGFQVTDVNQVIEALLPMASIALNFIPPESGINISPDDIPSPEALTGLRPNASVGYLTKTGATLIARYDTPISMESSYGVMIGMLLPAIQQVREAARRTETLNNFRQLGLAALNFESANRRYPAAFSVDDDGQPLLSWRVHILPYLEEQELYERFHLDEPWDSPHNIKLLDEMPRFYKSISVVLPKGQTMALAPVTEASIISQEPKSGKLGADFADMTDGSANTILFVEGGIENAVPWTAPQDLNVEDLDDTNFNTGHPGTFCSVFGDGSTHAVSTAMDLDDFIGVCVMNDGAMVKP